MSSKFFAIVCENTITIAKCGYNTCLYNKNTYSKVWNQPAWDMKTKYKNDQGVIYNDYNHEMEKNKTRG